MASRTRTQTTISTFWPKAVFERESSQVPSDPWDIVNHNGRIIKGKWVDDDRDVEGAMQFSHTEHVKHRVLPDHAVVGAPDNDAGGPGGDDAGPDGRAGGGVETQPALADSQFSFSELFGDDG